MSGAGGSGLSGEMVTRSHPRCRRPHGHTCQQSSGRTCIERGCDEVAGTLWGPLWCPEHDAERLDNVSRGMESLLRTRPGKPDPTPDAAA